MDWKLELIVVPVSDVDRAKTFYLDQAGFDLIVDHRAGDFRVVQLVPHGSACAIAMMPIPPNQMEPGSLHGLHLVVTDIAAAYTELHGKGVHAGEPFHYGVAGSPEPGLDPNPADYATFFSFHDPDGNTWLVQEVGYTATEALET